MFTTATNTRRRFLHQCGLGFGGLGFATLLSEQVAAKSTGAGPLAPRASHFPAKARHVIQIFCTGGPSHVDTWDPKPSLAKYEGKSVPALGGNPLPSPFKFTRRGASGIEVSELFPQLGEHIDKLAVLRAVHTDTPEHQNATLMMNTGSGRLPRPSVGSWSLYGLGTENQNLPGFVAIGSGGFGGGKSWNSAFLPSVYQGTQIRKVEKDVERMIRNIRNPAMDLAEQRTQFDLVQTLNRRHAELAAHEADLEARIETFELAFRMQTAAAEVFDLSRESSSVVELYGGTSLSNTLILARRLVEAGVRFVQVWHGTWDHHEDIAIQIRTRAAECDRPIAGLLTDLDARGLLDETLVVWGGEFGRTPGYDKGGRGEPGRDHHSECFSTWLAGGGVKGGVVHGQTDEFGARGVADRVHVHDLHATVLALLGFDHEKLTYRYNGRDFRLTDVFGNVVQQVIS